MSDLNGFAIDARRIVELEAKVEELIEERNLAWDKGYTQGRDDAYETIEELTAALQKIASNKLVIGWQGAAYIATQALKQEDE